MLQANLPFPVLACKTEGDVIFISLFAPELREFKEKGEVKGLPKEISGDGEKKISIQVRELNTLEIQSGGIEDGGFFWLANLQIKHAGAFVKAGPGGRIIHEHFWGKSPEYTTHAMGLPEKIFVWSHLHGFQELERWEKPDSGSWMMFNCKSLDLMVFEATKEMDEFHQTNPSLIFISHALIGHTDHQAGKIEETNGLNININSWDSHGLRQICFGVKGYYYKKGWLGFYRVPVDFSNFQTLN